MGVGGQRHTSTALSPGERSDAHRIGGWVGPRIILDGYGISLPHRLSISGPSRSQRLAISAGLSRSTSGACNGSAFSELVCLLSQLSRLLIRAEAVVNFNDILQSSVVLFQEPVSCLRSLFLVAQRQIAPVCRQHAYSQWVCFPALLDMIIVLKYLVESKENNFLRKP